MRGGLVLIETERLRFRKYTDQDIEYLYQLTSDPEVMQFIGRGVPWTWKETEIRLQKLLHWYGPEESTGLMLAFHKQTDDFVGHAGLVPQYINGVQELEIGYWICKRYWRQGYGYETAAAWKQHGLIQLGRKRLISIIHPDNLGSIHIAMKNGLKYSHNVMFNGISVHLYSILQQSIENI